MIKLRKCLTHIQYTYVSDRKPHVQIVCRSTRVRRFTGAVYAAVLRLPPISHLVIVTRGCLFVESHITGLWYSCNLAINDMQPKDQYLEDTITEWCFSQLFPAADGHEQTVGYFSICLSHNGNNPLPSTVHSRHCHILHYVILRFESLQRHFTHMLEKST